MFLPLLSHLLLCLCFSVILHIKGDYLSFFYNYSVENERLFGDNWLIFPTEM